MEPGGFLQAHLPSPPASTLGSPSSNGLALPITRTHPLKRGSSKESAVIAHIDEKLLEISRRYERRTNPEREYGTEGGSRNDGYVHFGEATKDLESITDAIWVTGTPILQTSYLLTVALAVLTYLPSFPFHPRPTFRLLEKLALAFASLLQGSNALTGERLPGFEGLFGARGIDTTKRVRIRGVVERTRVVVVEVAAGKSGCYEEGSIPQTTTDEDTSMDDEAVEDDDDNESPAMRTRGNWEMEVARVYERTIVLLGESLEPSTARGSD